MATNTKCAALNWIRQFISAGNKDYRLCINDMYYELADKKNIKLIFVPGRLLLSGIKVPDFTDPMVAECNGLVYSTAEDRLLVIPPALCSTKVNIGDITIDESYKLYDILDGTVLSLYYYENEWVISTTNSIDNRLSNIANQILTHTRPRQDYISYSDLFDDAVAQYKEFSTARLDKACCYNVVLFHHAIHPFVYGVKKCVWLVRCTNTTTFVESVPDIGLPVQKPLPMQSKTAILRKNEQALSAFVRDKTTPPHFGYILRSTSARGALANVILPSTLFESIKLMCYESGLNRIIRANNHDKYLYININAFVRVKEGHATSRFIDVLGDPLRLYPVFQTLINCIAERLYIIYTRASLPNDHLSDIVQRHFQQCLSYFKPSREQRRILPTMYAMLRHLIMHQKYIVQYYWLMLDEYNDIVNTHHMSVAADDVAAIDAGNVGNVGEICDAIGSGKIGEVVDVIGEVVDVIDAIDAIDAGKVREVGEIRDAIDAGKIVDAIKAGEVVYAIDDIDGVNLGEVREVIEILDADAVVDCAAGSGGVDVTAVAEVVLADGDSTVTVADISLADTTGAVRPE